MPVTKRSIQYGVTYMMYMEWSKSQRQKADGGGQGQGGGRGARV